MRITHFETLRPVCPVCRDRERNQESRLEIGSVSREVAEQIVEGVLQCSNAQCQSEFPILDGVPIILPRLRAYIAENIFQLNARNDLSSITESILGDCCSQGSVLDSMRQHLSCYVWSHYADLDPLEPPDSRHGSIVRILEHGLELEFQGLAQDLQSSHRRMDGPNIDIGCGPGRTTIALSDRTDQLTLGIDLNFSMLRIASNLLRTNRVSYPRRRVGLVYDRREFEVSLPHLELVDFWACDALDLPFAHGLFARSIGMNVLDSVHSPLALLQSIANATAAGGSIILACPYDWTATVTPVESWIGGHSQRSLHSGECPPSLRRLLAHVNAESDAAEPSLQWVNELDNLPWTIRMHDRSQMQYQVHLIHVRKKR